MFLRKRDRIKPAKRSKKLAPLAIMVVGAGAAYGWYSYNQLPSVGVVATQSLSQEVMAAETEVKYSNYSGETASFSYPSTYDTTRVNAASGPYVEQFTLNAYAGALDTRKLAISVRKNTNDITEDSAYAFRRNKPDEYAVEKTTISGKSYDLITKKDGSEVVYFISGDSYYATVTGTSSRPGGAFLNDTKKVVETFRWNQ